MLAILPFKPERAVNVEIVSREKSKVQANVTTAHILGDDVRGEIIIGNIGVYLRVLSIPSEYVSYIHIMLENLAKEDKAFYSCLLNSTKLDLRNQRFICDDSKWRQIYEHDTGYGHDTLKFDLSVEVEVHMLEMKNPFTVLYEDAELTDFELCADDGSVKFHSAVLACASPVLRQMLAGQWVETKSRSLQLQNTSKNTLQHLKDYLYLSVLPNEGAEHLLLLGSYYLMTELENKCTDKLLKNVTAESSNELMKFALANNLNNLYYGFLKLVKDGGITIDVPRV